MYSRGEAELNYPLHNSKLKGINMNTSKVHFWNDDQVMANIKTLAAAVLFFSPVILIVLVRG